MTPMRWIPVLESCIDLNTDAKQTARILFNELSDNLPDPEVLDFEEYYVMINFNGRDGRFVFSVNSAGQVGYTGADMPFNIKDGIPAKFFENAKAAYII